MSRTQSPTTLQRRINYVQAQSHEVATLIANGLAQRWPDRAMVPYYKARAKLRRELERLVLKNNVHTTKN